MQNKLGFTLLEIGLVVGIIGIVGAVSVPRFQAFQARAKQAEARNNLLQIAQLQDAFRKANQVYAGTLADLGFHPAAYTRYQYALPVAGETTFLGLAQAASPDVILSGCGARDTWTVDQDARLTVTTDCAAK